MNTRLRDYLVIAILGFAPQTLLSYTALAHTTALVEETHESCSAATLDLPTDLSVVKTIYPAGKDFSFAFDPSQKLNVYTGEFPITRQLGVLVELSGHYADLRREGVQFFGMGHAGVVWHF